MNESQEGLGRNFQEIQAEGIELERERDAILNKLTPEDKERLLDILGKLDRLTAEYSGR